MKISILLLLAVAPAICRHVRDLRRKGKEEEPFSVQNDLFSQALSLSAPDGSVEEEDLSRELSVTTSEIFTGPTLAAAVTPLPPGYSPQPPGFQTEEEAKMFRNQSKSVSTEMEPKEDRFHMSSGSDEISVEKSTDTNKEIRNFQPELISVGELTLKPPGMYDPDSMASEPAFEGSGATFEVDNTTSVFLNATKSDETAPFMINSTISEQTREMNLTEIVENNKLFESPQAISEVEPVRKVFGDAGRERGCGDEEGNEEKTRSEGKSKKTIDVDTFLVAGEGSDPTTVADFGLGNDTDLRPRGVHAECPPPQLCAKNCFISKNELGCQVCECLWQALTCESDSDCPERSQHCDLGKCDCSEGFVQDMSRSGMCKVADAISGEDLSLESLGVEKEETVTQEAPHLDKPEKGIGKGLIEEIQKKAAAYFGKRHRREALGEKPRSAERLQWPGVCDPQNNCPSPLVCIQGDCWQLPDKPLRRPLLRDSVPDSYIISSDDWSDELEEKLFPSPRTKTFHRFVDRHPTFKITKEMLERTTMESPTDEASVNSIFHVKKSTFHAEEPLLAPSKVSEILPKRRTAKQVQSTAEITTTSVPDEDEGLPPAPPPPGKEDSQINKWPEVSENDVARAFTKFIELPREEVLKPIPRVEKKSEERALPKPPTSEFLDPVEFPISSQLEELERDGFKVEAPKALSVKPTEDELESQKTFERALEQRRRQRKRLKVGSVTTTVPIVETTPQQKFESFTTSEEKIPQIAPRRRAPQKRPLIPVKETTKKAPVYVPPVGELLPGVWYPLEESSIRRAPMTLKTSSMHPVTSTSTVTTTRPPRVQRPSSVAKGKRNPIKIDAVVNRKIDDECSSDAQCGRHSLCCLKHWCDKKNFCSTARFCLPSCSSSKLVKPGRVGIVYD